MGRWAQAKKRGTDRGATLNVTPPVEGDFVLSCEDVVLGVITQPTLVSFTETHPFLAIRWRPTGVGGYTFQGYYDLATCPVAVDGTCGPGGDHPDGLEVEAAWSDDGLSLLSGWSDPIAVCV